MSTVTVVKAECLICGFVTTDPSSIELWDGYGECVGPNHPDGAVQHSLWTVDERQC